MPRLIRALSVIALVLASGTRLNAQATTIAARTSDVATIDSIISALYATISGPVGQPRQWDRFATLFHPDARLIPSRCPTGGGPCSLRVLTPASYRQLADSLLVADGFTETELVRHTERYGAIAHAFSSYASFHRGETAPFARGINSIQLFWDGSRWWVLQIFWDAERANNPLPPEFAAPAPK
jgi:hypothetical protein